VAHPGADRRRRAPFLFSQCQSIHARSVVPLQDTPRVRIRYRARVTVPAALRPSWRRGSSRARSGAGSRRTLFEMPQPIPPYLLALAVGHLASRDVGPRSRVWAEPEVVEKAAWEFAGVDAMLVAAEKLFGPYDWDRFDVLTMPPSFPYGGMENPRLTFLTPTLLAGDRSLVNVLAHELAHSWTGNLVTNANADHFWLNEGFTVWASGGSRRRWRPRVQRAARGAGPAEPGEGRRGLQGPPGVDPAAHRLRGRGPRRGLLAGALREGYLFLRAIEEAVGRPAFDAFLRRYLDAFRFQSITTEDFTCFVQDALPACWRR
jgi:aminopeptidase N